MLMFKHAAWVCVSRFGVPRNALAVLLILHCALWSTSGLAAKAEDTSETDSLNRQVVDLYQANKYQEAIPIARQLVAINEEALGPDHPDTATSLNNLAALYYGMGDYTKAEPLYRRPN
jgi:tetratricopeptide (TPR) repeat protein